MLKALSEEPERSRRREANRFSLPDFCLKRGALSFVLSLAVNVEQESDPTDKGLRCQGRCEEGGGVGGAGPTGAPSACSS